MNRIDLDGQVAVVTGGASGFGLATAKRFLESGAKVSLWDRDPSTLDQAVKLLGDGTSSEVVDVTGWLGGYNFQWAWSSGWAAGTAIAERAA